MFTKLTNQLRFIKQYIFHKEATSKADNYHNSIVQLSQRGIQSDNQLSFLHKGMITPFLNRQVRGDRASDLGKVVSYGLSSYGYDIRLSDKDFYTFNHLPGRLVDPKDFDRSFLEPQLPTENYGKADQYFIIPGNSYALGVSVEHFKMPSDVMAICMTKSTYARAGIFCNITPIEPGWEGYLTLEIANCANSDVKVYANEGIAQILFFKGNQPDVTYDKRNGKYNKQPNKVVTAKV